MTPDDLIYAERSRCPCGAGLAYPKGVGPYGPNAAWDCSDILLDRAIEKDQPGSTQHTARLPFIFYEIRSERQPGAHTTRPES